MGEATVRSGQAELAATVAQIRNDTRRAYYGVLVADARLTSIEGTPPFTLLDFVQA